MLESPAVWPACFPFGQHMKFWDGSVRLSLVPAQVAVSAHAGQLSVVWSGKKAASVENPGVQGDCLAQAGFGPWHLHSILLGWSFELGTPLPVPEGSSQRPDWLSKTSQPRGSHQLCCPAVVRAGSLPVPAAGQARLRECVCQCACPPSSCPQTLSGLASPFLLQWLWLNTVGSFTKEDGKGDKVPATPPATADCPAWHQSQEHLLPCSGISIPCFLPGSGSPCCPFGQKMPEKGNASPGEFHAG